MREEGRKRTEARKKKKKNRTQKKERKKEEGSRERKGASRARPSIIHPTSRSPAPAAIININIHNSFDDTLI